ncbi:MAG: hypothetical protein ACOC44_12105 [Promethearchaeia archaeon]
MTRLYLLSNNSRFFYQINKRLSLLKIKLNIWNNWEKLPREPNIVLTTKKEVDKVADREKDSLNLLIYEKNGNFEKFFMRVIAAYRIGFKEQYSKLLFSIDPGTKRIGLTVFLDDYFLLSKTYYHQKKLKRDIKKYIHCFDNPKHNLIHLSFKIGRGILPICLEFVDFIFTSFYFKREIDVFLIDESKSSKIRIHNRKNRISKDEASALLLALRDGIKTTKATYDEICTKLKNKKLNKDKYLRKKTNIDLGKESINFYKHLSKEILNGKISLVRAKNKIRSYFNTEQLIEG